MSDRPTRNEPKRAKTTAAHHHHQTQDAATSTSFSNPTTFIIIPNLPNELSIEILSRLPVKSLLQFQTISKSWLKLILSPNFTKTHLLKSINDPNLTYHHLIFSSRFPFSIRHCSLPSLIHADTPPFTNANEVHYPMRDPNNNFVWTIAGSVNGLVCIASDEAVFLWNPTVRKYKKLPSSGLKGNQSSSGTLSFYGFGYDLSNDDYKVVGISFAPRSTSSLRNPSDYEAEVKVYSRNFDRWSRIEGFNGIPRDRSVVFVNGKLHWASRATFEMHGEWSIVSLDMADETYGEVEKPNYGQDKFGFVLGVLGGWLCVLCNYLVTHCVDIWVMKEYGVSESWSKIVNFSNSNHSQAYIFNAPLILFGDGKILLELGSAFLLYNPKDDSRRYLEFDDFHVAEALLYVESLASPGNVVEGKCRNDKVVRC